MFNLPDPLIPAYRALAFGAPRVVATGPRRYRTDPAVSRVIAFAAFRHGHYPHGPAANQGS